MVTTFLVCSDYREAVKVLDKARLGKQRVEAYQILQTLKEVPDRKKGYQRHPAVLMWKGFEESLKMYFNASVQEWTSRGYENNYEYFEVDEKKVEHPWWKSFAPLHYSHQASLSRKDPEYYKGKFPELPEEYTKLGYLWPSRLTEEQVTRISKGEVLSPSVLCDVIRYNKVLGKCKVLIKSGKRKGEECGAGIKIPGEKACGRHS